MGGTIEKRPNGRITIHLGAGNGTVDAPEGVTPDEARKIACERYPLGTLSRRTQIIAALHAIAKEIP